MVGEKSRTVGRGMVVRGMVVREMVGTHHIRAKNSFNIGGGSSTTGS